MDCPMDNLLDDPVPHIQWQKLCLRRIMTFEHIAYILIKYMFMKFCAALCHIRRLLFLQRCGQYFKFILLQELANMQIFLKFWTV